MSVRRAILAGTWYPGTAAECRTQIQDFIRNQPEIEPLESRPWLGGVVPHAGWFFSGNIACNVIRHLSRGPRPDVVVLFGMHLHARSPNHIMAEGAWETPLGDLEIHAALAAEMMKAYPFEVETPRRFVQDNTVEVQLPFIRYFLKDVKILALGVPPSPDTLILADFLVKTAKGMGLTLKFIGSTDLTHYGSNYGFQPKGSGREALEWVKKDNDARLIERILALDPEGVLREAREHQNACCSGAAAAAIKACVASGAQEARKLAYATSHDKSPGESFVGYAGVLFA